MTSETLLIFIISYILLVIKPGPGQAFRIGCALDKGFACAMSVRLGVSVICTFYFLVVVFSYNNLIQYFESFAILFKILGGAYLIYLGVRGFLKDKSAIQQEKKPPSTSSLLKLFTIGMVLSLSNPIDIVYFLSVLPNLVPVGALTTSGVIIGASIVFFTGVILDILILTLVVQGKGSFKDSPVVGYLNVVANLSFILIGAFFIFSAFFLGEYKLELL